MPTLTHRQLHVPGHGEVHALDLGGAGPLPVVAVHGLDGSAANHVDVGPLLGEHGPVLAPDLPGFGRTPIAGRPLTVSAYGALVAALARTLPAPPLLLGNSLGGPVVLAAAAELGDACAGVVLLAPAVPRAGRGPVAWSFVGEAASLHLPGVAGGVPDGRAALPPRERVRSLLDLCYARPGARESAAAFEEMVAVAAARDPDEHRAAWVGAARSLWRLLVRRGRFHAVADRVTAPVLVVEGRHDPVIPRTSIADTLRRHPGWTHVVLDVGHVPQLEDPAATAAAVRSWLAQSGA